MLGLEAPPILAGLPEARLVLRFELRPASLELRDLLAVQYLARHCRGPQAGDLLSLPPPEEAAAGAEHHESQDGRPAHPGPAPGWKGLSRASGGKGKRRTWARSVGADPRFELTDRGPHDVFDPVLILRVFIGLLFAEGAGRSARLEGLPPGVGVGQRLDGIVSSVMTAPP